MIFITSSEISLTRPLFIEVSVPSQEREQSCICVLGVSTWSLSVILLLHFTTVLTAWYFRTVLTAWYFRTVLTAWYFRTVLNCSDSVVF